jgi:hypothetical protein
MNACIYWIARKFIFQYSLTTSYQQMHQIHLLFNTVLIIYIKTS